jgi:hypothetical protein
MKSNQITLIPNSHHAKKHLYARIGVAFIVLITLQFYLLPLVPLVSGNDFSKYAAYTYIYVMISYTLIVAGIMIFHNNGVLLFSDLLTLMIILLSLFFRSSLGGDHELTYRAYLFVLGIILCLFMITKRRSIKLPKLKSVLLGIIWAVVTVLVLASIRGLLDPAHGTLPESLSSYIINMIVFQLSFVAVIEEACFRGLLFGFMVMNGLSEKAAFFIQGVLFWGIHYMKIGDPLLFFLIIPLYTLSATLIIKKFRIISLSILMHILNNTFAGILVALF